MERGGDSHGRKNSWTDGESGASGSSRSTPVHGVVGISSAAGSSTGSGAASREETPGPMPKHRYSRVCSKNNLQHDLVLWQTSMKFVVKHL